MKPGSIVLFGRHARHLVSSIPAAPTCRSSGCSCRRGWEDWFAAIGRPRTPGEAMPEAFERPNNVADVQARLRFVAPKPR